ALAGVGVALAFGSDSPVTPLDPWGTVRAAAGHHNPASRLSVKAAFAAHTRGGWRAVHRDGHGVLAPGAPAPFPGWQRGTGGGLGGGGGGRGVGGGAGVGSAADERWRVCRRTVLRGEVIYDVEGT